MCFFALGIYIIRTLKSAIKYFKDNGNKIFPTLLLAYSGIAAVIIFLSTLKLYVLPNSATKLMIIEDVDAYVINLTYIGFHIIMAAFYLNFSKAFYMLHELDHGHYDPIQNWNEKLNASKKWKRITEAFLRWLIAIFFIVLELTLHNVSSDGLIAALRTSAIFGLILYSLMLLWAMLNRFLLINQNEEETIKKKMKWQFYIAWAGIFNSLYIVLLAMLKKWWIIMPFSIATLLSIIILGYILIHMSKTSEETA